ncbi:uncharacterized protein LOC133190480 isoform X2 [Saccostrea echinata]|uniref:uncharacterized protein LOC133190480 isoform X2 n=1 Tax=Saccostrea echinata TaxID=191078 RepID=UPI002A817547|nr:uncharacterized protein LOC133190480 isoform X2 [Saccostrea echinata]
MTPAEFMVIYSEDKRLTSLKLLFVEGMWNLTTQATWHISQTLSSVDEKVFNLTASLATSSVCALDSLFRFVLEVCSDVHSLVVDVLDSIKTFLVQFSDKVKISAFHLEYFCTYMYDDIVSSFSSVHSSLFGFGLDFAQQILSLSVQKFSLVSDIISFTSTKGFLRLWAVFCFLVLCVAIVCMAFEFLGRLDAMHKTVASLAEENRQLMCKINAEFKAIEEQRKEKEKAISDIERQSKALSMWLNVYVSGLINRLEKQSAGSQFVRRSLKSQKLL